VAAVAARRFVVLVPLVVVRLGAEQLRAWLSLTLQALRPDQIGVERLVFRL